MDKRVHDPGPLVRFRILRGSDMLLVSLKPMLCVLFNVRSRDVAACNVDKLVV